jgi:recombination protein RecA
LAGGADDRRHGSRSCGGHAACFSSRRTLAKESHVSRDSSSDSQQAKQKAIHEAVEVIKKQFGKGAIMRLDGSDVTPVEIIRTGSLALDVALGVGGLPRGRVVEIFGPESSGKTTLSLHAIAEAQATGGVCAFIDAEHALDTAYARRLGVKLDDLLVSQPDCGEQALEIVDTLVRTGAIDLIVIDSVAALTPRAEIEGEMGDSHMGLQARLMSQALRKLTAITGKTRTVVIFINQLRQKIGLVFGNPETTTGGNALKFYCSVRLDIRKKKPIKRGEEIIGSTVRVKVVKNKLAPPFREAEFEILYGTGVNKLGELVDTAERLGVVEKNGAWYSWDGEKLGQGRDKTLELLSVEPERAARLRDRLLDHARTVAQNPPAGAGNGHVSA